MIKFLKDIFTPLFLASMMLLTIAGQAQGWLEVGYYVASGVLFVCDIIDCRKKGGK